MKFQQGIGFEQAPITRLSPLAPHCQSPVDRRHPNEHGMPNMDPGDDL